MSRTTVEEIKARIPIEDLISSYIKVERSGRSLKAKCPFHNEKTPSFFISPERGGYYCFGCGAKGDIFTFVEQFEGLDFRGALKVLAERAGVPLVVDQKADGEKDRLFAIMEQAAKYFEEQLDKCKTASDYVAGRGIKPETRSAFRIGWAPDGWNNLQNFLKGKGWSETVMEKAGLIKKKETEDKRPEIRKTQNIDQTNPASHLSPHTSSFYDRFRGRIMFPITDSSGRVVAFTGRILNDDGKSAKYLNSPETTLFNKSQILFGLDKAKSEIRRMNYSILVEGQMDLVLSHQAGVKNAVAASGTALTDQVQGETGVVSNLGMVRRLSLNMIIALDSDKAGRMAAMRAVAATALGMGMAVKIADIEGGKDPADLILNDPDEWKKVLRNAKHVVEFELANVIKETVDPHKVARAVKDRVFPFLSKLESEMDKAFYIKLIAEQAKLHEQAVWEDLRKFESANRGKEISNKRLEIREKQNEINNSLNPKPYTLNPSTPHRLDLVERRIFGLLQLMESAKLPAAIEYRSQVKKIAGRTYEERLKRVESIAGDLVFEAEALFGIDQNGWEGHIKDLMINFEQDIVNQELLAAMTDLKTAERAGNQAAVEDLAKKCHALSIRKAEINSRRNNY